MVVHLSRRRSRDLDASFVAYVAARRAHLRRAAYLLAGDWNAAEDLVQATLVKVYLAWSRVELATAEAYVRRAMLRTYLDDRRRPWAREVPSAELPEPRSTRPVPIEDTQALRAALERLSPRQRATVVLRHWYGLSVEETAAELACSAGTVKSQTARALASLRRDLLGDRDGRPADAELLIRP